MVMSRNLMGLVPMKWMELPRRLSLGTNDLTVDL